MTSLAQSLFDIGTEATQRLLAEANAMKTEPRWVAELNAHEAAQAIRDEEKKEAHFDRLSRLSHHGR